MMDNHHLRVLLIEDRESDYRITRDLLRKVESPQFELEWVRTYDAGVEALERSQHDVVLLDDRLGQRSGLELLRQVVGSGCQTPIIMLTGTSDREADLKAMEAGAADYLEKDQLSARLLERSIRYVVERKRVEAALAAERNLLRTLIDNIPDAVYAKDTESRFILCNKTHLRYLGCENLNDVVGKTDFDLFPHEIAAKFYADEQAVIESGQPLINHEELTQDMTSGSQFWAATTKAPLRDETGKVLGTVGVTHDLTRRKRMEEALAAERNLLRTLIDTVPDAIFTKDKDSRFVLSNKSHLRILGAATMDEVVGKTDFDLFPSEMAAKFYADEQAVIETGQPHTDQEERTIDLTGDRELWVTATKVPLRDEAGNVLGVVGITRDLTERKQAEDALRASETRYRTLVRNLPGIIVVMFDHDLRYTLIEGEGLSKLGYDRDAMEGKTIWEVLRPEHLAQYEPVLRAALAGQETLFETEVDGFIFHATVIPVKDAQKETVGCLIVAQDITERKQAEKALRDSETRYRLVARATNDAIWDWNLLTDQVEWSNAISSHFGYGSEQVARDFAWWNEQIHPEDRERITSSVNAVIEAGGQYWTQEYRFRRADGSYALVIDRGYVARDEAGKALRMIGSMLDITARKQTEERLAAERSMLRTLIDALPDYIFVKDRAGRFVVSNKAHALAVKVSNPDDLAGKIAADLFPPDMAAQFDADDQAIMESGEPLFNLERQTIDAAGSPIWVSTIKVPLHDDTGQVTGLVGISRDITERRLAEEAVQDSLTRYRLVARATNDVIWDWNLMADTIEWNEAIETVFGYTRDQVSQEVTWWINHIHPDDEERLGARFAELISGEQPIWTEEHRFLKADGTYADVIDRGVIATDENGTPVRMIGSMIDITARKRAEEALRESEERYRATFEQAGVGVAHNDNIGRFLWVNQKYCDIMGYTLDELRQRTWQEVTHPDDVDKDWAQAEQLLAGKIQMYSMEKRYIRKDGSPVWVSMTTSLLRDAAGAIKHGIVVIEDISERKQAEAALQESEERFRSTFEQVTVGMALVSSSERWMRVNRKLCEILGYTSDEMLGRTWMEMTHPDDLDKDWEQSRRLVAGEIDGYSMEKRFIRKDGTPVWTSLTTSLVRYASGDLNYGVAVIEDISARKQTEEALRESETRFRATFAQAAVGITQTSMDGKYLRVNQKFCDIVGYTREELQQLTWQELTHADDLSLDLELTDQLLAGEIPTFSIEERYIRKDKSRIWVNVTLSLVRTAEGEPEYFIAVIEDISARKQAEVALRESEERFRILFEHSPDAIVLIDPYHPSIDWPIVECNEAACTMNGYTREELIGQTIDLLNVTPATRAERADYFRRVREQGILKMEAQHRRKDGSLIHIQIHTSLVNLNGRGLILGIDRDITERIQAEEALRASETRFRATFAQAAVGIAHTDVKTARFIRINQKFCDIVGYTREEMRALTWKELTHPDDLGMSVERARKLLTDDTNYSEEKRYVCKNGTLIWVNVTVSLVRTPEGEPEYFIAVIEDISWRKQAEETLREQQTFLRQVIDANPSLIFVKDWDGKFTLVNKTHADYMGTTVEEMEGKSDAEFGVSPAENERFLQDDREVMTTLQPKFIPEETLTPAHSRKTHWLQTSKVPLFSADGKVRQLLGVAIDITERKHAEDALRESEEKFRQLAENVTHAFWLRDPDARQILYVSPAYETVLGRSRASYYENPQSFLEAIHPEDRERVEVGFKFRLKGGFDDQFRVVDPDGSVRWVWARTFPVHDADGEVYRVVGLAEDITLRKHAEAQEIELAAERTRIGVVERFISDASHDLRTPLSIMQTSLWLLEKNTDPEKRKRHADNLNEQITHITRVLEDFLNLGKLDVLSHADLHLEACDLSALVHAIHAAQQPLAAQKQHQVKLNLAAELPPIMADKAELERALRHLIVNAINFTPDGGTITLETRQEKEYTVFEVRDNGIGIGPDDLPFIFERFYRADKARDIATGGSGLGLTIAKKIIEAHGGKIEVESTPGEGSIFRVRL